MENCHCWGTDQGTGKTRSLITKNRISHTTHHLSTTSTHLSTKIKDLKTAKEMWDQVKSDAYNREHTVLPWCGGWSCQVWAGRYQRSEIPPCWARRAFPVDGTMVTTISLAMGFALSNSHYQTIINAFLTWILWPSTPDNYSSWRRASAASGAPSSSKMKPDDLMNFFIEEARIESLIRAFEEFWLPCWQCMGERQVRSWEPEVRSQGQCQLVRIVGNPRHAKLDCYSKGGGKEGQGPRQKKCKKGKKKTNKSAA